MIWNNPPKFKTNPPKPGKVVSPEDLAKSGSEDGHQAAVFCWAAANVGRWPELKWLHAIPNGGQRHIAEATKMVATGLRGGIWDVFLPCPVNLYTNDNSVSQYAGLYIEIKEPKRRNHKNGGLSDDQVAFGKYAERIGYYCKVCYSWIEVKETIIDYLEGKV
jgi:hypothetical protein